MDQREEIVIDYSTPGKAFVKAVVYGEGTCKMSAIKSMINRLEVLITYDLKTKKDETIDLCDQ